MLRFLGLLLVVWLVLTVVGAVVKGLFWLAVVGLILFVATAVVGAEEARRPAADLGSLAVLTRDVGRGRVTTGSD